MSLREDQAAEDSASQSQPLLPSSHRPTGSSANLPDTSSSMVAVKRNNLLSPTAIAVQAFAILFVGLIWSLVFQKLPGNLFSLPLFGYHPLLQSLSLLLLAQSILVLQPTSQARPQEKKAAFNVHQIVNAALILPILTAGASIMFYLHHPNNHFISWHGILGTAVLAWMWVQAAIGAASVWGGGKLLGGEAKAKGVWKWHRLSGYVLLPAFLLTLFSGATQTGWSQQNASKKHHFAVGVVLIAIGIGVALRVQRAKLPKLATSS